MRRRDSGSLKANGPGKELKVSIKKSVGTLIFESALRYDTDSCNYTGRSKENNRKALENKIILYK